MKKRIRFIVTVWLCFLLCVGCSTRRNTAGTRAYHSFTTRYNLLFNAEEAYEEILERQTESFTDNYAIRLPYFPVAPATKKSQPGGPFDAVVDKASRAIREHSITTKPRRDPTQRQTEAYRQWLRQEEFNPLLKKAWLLLGKAHLQNHDYEEALAVFSHIQHMYKNESDLITETEIWMMRVYTEQNRMHDAADIVYILSTKTVPDHLHDLFHATYTHYLLENESYAEAIPRLRKTIETEKKPGLKKRFQFLLGQVFTMTGDKEEAYRAFEAVKGLSTPYELTLQATISQLAVAQESQQPALRSALEKMRRKSQDANNPVMNQTSPETPRTDHSYRTVFTEPTTAQIHSDTRQTDSLRKAAALHESLYQTAYHAYQKGDDRLVASTFEIFRERFPDSALMPQIQLLHALSAAYAGNAEQTGRLLSELLEKFPESDAAPLAQSIMDGLSQGKMLAGKDTLHSPGGLFPSGNRDMEEKWGKELLFSADRDIPHRLLLIFSPRSTDKNRLLFSTANFNFSRFRLRTFDFSYLTLPDAEALSIQSFLSFDEATRYLQLLRSDSLFRESLTGELEAIILSEENLLLLQTRGTTEAYKSHFMQHYGPLPGMIQPMATAAAMENDESVGQKQEKIVSLETTAVASPQRQREINHPQPVPAERRITPEERQRELEQKADEALQQSKANRSAKSRKELLKERERVRQQKIRQREKELKERARKREEALRQREREREQKISGQGRLGKEK